MRCINIYINMCQILMCYVSICINIYIRIKLKFADDADHTKQFMCLE